MTGHQMRLLNELELNRTLFKTENYSMSLGELANLYRSHEIIIDPAFQRLFRWSEGQKVKLIESLVLGIPLPPIFVYQNREGIWELVDGLQRVSTILQFMGALRDTEPLVLTKTKYLPSFEGFVWDSRADNQVEFPESLKLSFRRSKIDLVIIQSDSHPNAKFEVFQRLNTGGSNASKQEIRNSVAVMRNSGVFAWFEELAKTEDFLNTIAISERLIAEEYNTELMLRLIALLKFPYDNKIDLGDYLDSINDKLVAGDQFDFDEVRQRLISTFRLLNAALGDKAFKRYDGTEFKGKFLESAFECIAVGLAENIHNWQQIDSEVLKDRVQRLYSQIEFISNIGSGSNSKTRIPRIVPFGKAFFAR